MLHHAPGGLARIRALLRLPFTSLLPQRRIAVTCKLVHGARRQMLKEADTCHEGSLPINPPQPVTLWECLLRTAGAAG